MHVAKDRINYKLIADIICPEGCIGFNISPKIFIFGIFKVKHIKLIRLQLNVTTF